MVLFKVSLKVTFTLWFCLRSVWRWHSLSASVWGQSKVDLLSLVLLKVSLKLTFSFWFCLRSVYRWFHYLDRKDKIPNYIESGLDGNDVMNLSVVGYTFRRRTSDLVREKQDQAEQQCGQQRGESPQRSRSVSSASIRAQQVTVRETVLYYKSFYMNQLFVSYMKVEPFQRSSNMLKCSLTLLSIIHKFSQSLQSLTIVIEDAV